MKGIIKGILFVPFALIFLIFAVSNRADVLVVLDPFGMVENWAQISVPLFLVIITAALLGVLAGGAGAWWANSKDRARARKCQREADMMRQELERLRRLSDEASAISMIK
jgi:uncharacterized integral membrane protein